MDYEIREDWCEALRSGEHIQCQNMLESPDGAQCCLGVLCDILDIPRHKIRYPWQNKDARVGISYGNDEDTRDAGELPIDVAEMVGLNHVEMGELMQLNDAHHATFDEIADYIEAEL